jgi:dihydropyrimidinase
MLDLIIRNGKVFNPEKGFLDVEVGIKDGKIAEIGKNLSGAAEVLDASGNIVMPGVIDPHIHLGIFNDFAVECEHETRAALAGGVTTCGLFMGGDQSYLGQVGGLIDVIEAKSSVDIFMHLAIFTPDQMNEMEACYQEFGITSFKFYMAGVKGVFPNVSDGFILDGFKKIAKFGDNAIACVHCEDQSIIDRAFDEVSTQNPAGTLSDWAKTGPDIAEEEAIMRACYLAEKAGNRLYIVHISSKAGADRLAKIKKNEGATVFGETTSAYLTVNKDGAFGLKGKMLPPLRDASDNDGLWEAVKNDTIDSLGTDNVSMTLEVKQEEKGMLGAMPGYPILQTHFPAMISEGYHKRGIDIEKIITKATVNPAKIFGLYPQKGVIAEGSDADIVILDLNLSRTVESKDLFSYSDFSLFEGQDIKGWPRTVLKGGKVAYSDGKIVVEPGFGSFLRRQL